MQEIADANKNKYMLPLLLVACISSVPFGYAMESASPKFAGLHAEITRDALAGVLADATLEQVIEANLSQDLENDGAREKRRHFDASTLNASIQYVNREQAKALTYAMEADNDPESRADALRHLGLMLHTVQDFYTRSNYVELQLQTQQFKEDPYNIPLVDWTKLPVTLTAAKQGDPDDVLNKDSSTVGGGKTVISDKVTYHSVARDLAVRETQRQWNLFEILLRSKAGDKAPALLAALRKASTPTAAQARAAKEREAQQVILGDTPKEPDKPNSEDNEDQP